MNKNMLMKMMLPWTHGAGGLWRHNRTSTLVFCFNKKNTVGWSPAATRKGTAALHIKNRVKNEGGGFHHPKKHALSVLFKSGAAVVDNPHRLCALDPGNTTQRNTTQTM